MAADSFKRLLIRTPFERVAFGLRRVMELPGRLRHPELRDVQTEPVWVDRAVKRILARDSNAVDVGSHLGSMLSVFLRAAPEGRHMAFEPVPRKAAWLRQRFPEVDVLELALGADAGEVDFYVNTKRSGFSGLEPHGRDGDPLERIRVRVATIDEVVPAERPLRLLKLDVEGAELAALRGARRTLDRERPHLLFESTPSGLHAAGVKPRELFEHLGGCGYDVWIPREFVQGRDPLTREGFARAHVYPFRAFNFVGVPR